MTKFKRELSKYKPDVVTYNSNGSINSESYSKKVLDDKKKALEKLAKAEKTLTKAINENDFSSTEQMIKELSSGGGQEKSEKSNESVE